MEGTRSRSGVKSVDDDSTATGNNNDDDDNNTKANNNDDMDVDEEEGSGGGDGDNDVDEATATNDDVSANNEDDGGGKEEKDSNDDNEGGDDDHGDDDDDDDNDTHDVEVSVASEGVGNVSDSSSSDLMKKTSKSATKKTTRSKSDEDDSDEREEKKKNDATTGGGGGVMERERRAVSKKRSRSPTGIVSGSKSGADTPTPKSASSSSSSSTENVFSKATLQRAAQLVLGMNLQGLGTLLSTWDSSTNNNTSNSGDTDLPSAGHHSSSTAANSCGLPSMDQFLSAATKAVQENPPWVHLSKTDCAPQLQVEDKRRLIVKGGMRGYRMIRASHGVTLTNPNATSQQPLPNSTNLQADDKNKGKTKSNKNRENNISSTANNSTSTSAAIANSNGTGVINKDKDSNSYINHYYEIWVHRPPTVQEIMDNLPTNARLGKKLQDKLQQALLKQQIEEKQIQKDEKNSADNKRRKKARISNESNASTDCDSVSKTSSTVGGHLRVGWSMRTGDLQAPVGYDEWSYAIRSICGSIIHQSKRKDHWGGVGFSEGDVIGCAIGVGTTTTTTVASNGNIKVDGSESGDADTPSKEKNNSDNSNATTPTTTLNNQIRFFKNGQPMGQFIISRGKREGGAAFDHITTGTYYPAISTYMGGSCQINFGPHFVYAPKNLPSGMKIQPVSDLCPPPLSPEQALQIITNSPNPAAAATTTTSSSSATSKTGGVDGGGPKANTSNSADNNDTKSTKANSTTNTHATTATALKSTSIGGVSITSKDFKQLFRNKHPDMMKAFCDAVKCETQVHYDSYINHTIQHIQEVIQLRKDRKLSTSELQHELERYMLLSSSTKSQDMDVDAENTTTNDSANS